MGMFGVIFSTLVLFGSATCSNHGGAPSEKCPNPVDLCFILDSSGSVKKDGWNQTLEFTKAVIKSLFISNTMSRVGVVVFYDFAECRISLNEYTDSEKLQERVSYLDYKDGYTNTAGALNATAHCCFGGPGDRDGIKNVAIFISDGMPTVDIERVPRAIQALHNVAEVVISIGVGSNISEQSLRNISKSSDPNKVLTSGEDYFISANFGVLSDLEGVIAKVACPEPKTTPTTTSTTTATPTTPTSTPTSIPTPTTTQPACPTELDVCFILDRSGSQKDGGWRMVQQAAITLIKAFTGYPKFPHVGVVAFSSGSLIELEIDLSLHDLARLEKDINSIAFGDSYTDMAWALVIAATRCFKSKGDRIGVTNVAVLISDGMVTINEEGLPEAISSLHQAADKILAVGIGHSINETILRRVVAGLERPDRDVDPYVLIRPRDVQLDELATGISSMACGSTPAEIVEKPTTTAGPEMCDKAIDLCFVLDSSGSVKEDGWKKTLEFTENVTNHLQISSVKTQVGVVIFSDWPRVAIKLGSLPESKQLTNEIKSLKHLDGYTNTAWALQMTARRCFDPEVDRKEALNVAIFISDGVPNINKTGVVPATELLHTVADVVLSVGVGDEIAEDLLRNVTKRSDDKPAVKDRDFFLCPDFESLRDVLSRIVSMACVPV